jgi:anti-sigma factor RsiW
MKAQNVIELMCQEVVELVTEYLSHAMTAEDRARLEQHLLTCPPCTAHLAQVRTTLELARELRDAAPAGQAGMDAGAGAEPAAHDDVDLVRLFRGWSRK